jgi:SulP family sulfate permease
MLVALPSAIAFGVAIYGPLGGEYAAFGAFGGAAGAAAMGLVAGVLGGTRRLITAPCAPASAVLSAFVITLFHKGIAAPTIVLLLAIVGVVCGVLQIVLGMIGLGRLMKYMPYPVVSGYLTAIGVIIISSQMAPFLGVASTGQFWSTVLSPDKWHWQAAVIGIATIIAMVTAPKITKAVPSVIFGLLAGGLAFIAMALADHRLLASVGNPLIVGPLGGSGLRALAASLGRWHTFGDLRRGELALVVLPALTLTVLLSIDTLKTSIVVDVLSQTRHDSNRELMGQGCANAASALIGGLPGAGTMGATMVNISSGAQSSASSVIEGGLALLAFLVLSPFLSWVPVAALAGILIVIGARMIDRRSVVLLRSRATLVDFAVIVAVVITALTVSLISASGVGIALAILLFLREQIGGSIVRQRASGNELSSKRVRTPTEADILKEFGTRVAVYELQGSLFFGTANQLYTELEPELATRTYLILDMRRVQTIDVTAAEMLRQVQTTMAGNGGQLLFSQIPTTRPGGRDVQRYLNSTGTAAGSGTARVFSELDAALEWVEDRILEDITRVYEIEQPLALNEMELFANLSPDAVTALERCIERRSYSASDAIFVGGDPGDTLFLIRRGEVRINLPVDAATRLHLATFGRGTFFGEVAFLDGQTRSADAVACAETDVYVLSRASFDALATTYGAAANAVLHGLARTLAVRLRNANAELRAARS